VDTRNGFRHTLGMPKQDIDCAVIIALREEFAGNDTFRGFGDFFELSDAATVGPYQYFSFDDSIGVKRAGVVHVMEDMSPLAAYEASRDLLEEHNPTLVVNVGIAGALSRDLRLGDVLIADEVDAYDYRGKAVASALPSGREPNIAATSVQPDEFTFRWGGKTYLPSSEPKQGLTRLWQDIGIYAQWREACAERLRRARNIVIPDLVRAEYIGDKPRIEHGLVASGNTVSSSVAFKRKLLDSRNRLFLAIEMESSGVLRATEKLGYRSLVIKAISDLADDNKEQLENSTKDSIRGWSMSNALYLLSIACRQVLTFEVERTVRSAASHSVHPSISDERSRLLDFSVKHFKKQHRPFVNDIAANLDLYDSLFRPLVRSDIPIKGNIFLETAKYVITSSHPYPLRIDGKPGTGKTTFLTLLYLAIVELGKGDPSTPIPIYVNLRRYTTPERGKEHRWTPQAVADNDLAQLRRLLDSDSPFNIITLIDGVEEYVRYNDSIEMTVLDLVANCTTAKKIVGVGVNYFSNREKFVRRLQGDLNNPDKKILLDSVRTSDGNSIQAFISAFQKTYNVETGPAISPVILQKSTAFRLTSLDLLTISMIFDAVFDKGRYERTDNLGSFLKTYCENFLWTPTGSESLDDAAQLAFDYTVKPHLNLTIEKARFRRSWKLLHLHSIVRDFLVAWHTVQLVRKAGTQTDQSRTEDLDYVYPHSINRFSKDIVNSSRDSQFEVIDGAKRIFRERGHNAMPHASYLAGRVLDFGAREQARAWLRSECLPEVKKIQERRDSDLSAAELLLCRTVYISLAVLNDRVASEDYIRLLLERPIWNEVNRGFHLEYYGDIPFDPERQLSHSDGLSAFPKTFENLYGRIASNLRNGNYGLLDIEVFTLYSLAQFRYLASNQLDEGVRIQLLELIPSLSSNRHLSDNVREYIEMLKVNLADRSPFLAGRLIEKLYGMKTHLRAGWVDRTLPLQRIESIADHTYGALLLGIVFLPEDNVRGWESYDKPTVLKYLIIHDLGESISGDASPFDAARYRTVKEKERDAYHYLMMCRTYPGIANLAHYHSMWESFEKGADQNARIARDLDRLENLVQLYIYSREASIQDFGEWRDWLKAQISTEIGKEILSHLQDYFEQTEGTISRL
jgi:nucleoside phosphorylase/5'-deoxynucleotidase YfbR-like HD superfamily hydrolase